jgi:hypothetical protein
MRALWRKVSSAFGKKQTPIDAELDQIRRFIIEVGRAHIVSALVEQQLQDLLRSFGYPDTDVPSWLLPGEHVNLANAIVALRKQFKLPATFEAELHRFREERNDFTHNIWRDPDARIETGDDLEKLIKKVIRLYSKARALTNMFGRLKIVGHEIRAQVAMEKLERGVQSFTERYSAE